MKTIKKIKSIDDKIFFTQTPLLVAFLTQSYVRGDIIVLFPFLFLAILIGSFSLRLMLLLLAVFFYPSSAR